MYKILFILILITAVSWAPEIAFTQNNLSDKVSDCFGAVELPLKGDFNIDFTNSPGIFDDVHKYKDKLNYSESNSIWIHFKAPFDGKLSMLFSNPSYEMEAILFLGNENYCTQILNGEAPIVKYVEPNMPLSAIDTIEMKQGEHVYLYINSTQKQLNKLQISTDFSSHDFEKASAQLKSIVDRRLDLTASFLTISITDKETKLPVDAQLIITDSKLFDALYQGTDLLLPTDRSIKFNLKIDAIGYFFSDEEIKVSAGENETITLTLEPINTGKQIEISGIEFFPQSSEFTQDAEIKLKRIRDFLILNSDLKLEIQGHVHRMGKNNFSSKSLSKKRAKKVVKYLVNTGISKERLKAVGYGNLHMKYPEPMSKSEEQANRRVEIKIL
jgi:outer membrane protein OmpA-like peptidoglycan-associated protein